MIRGTPALVGRRLPGLVLALGLALLAPPVAAAESAAAACAPTLALAGDRAEVVLLSRALARYQREASPPAGCGHFQVTVRRTGPGLTVEIANGDGLDVVRQVGGAEVAAAVVDSWLQREFRAARPEVVAAAAAAPPPAPAAAPPGFRLELGPDAALGSEGSRWVGGHAGACVRAGGFCAGLLVRAERGAAIAGDPGITRRTTADLQATVELPIRLRGIFLVPGVGLGPGLLRADTTDPGPNAAGEVTGARKSTTFALRSSASLGLVVPLPASFGVLVGVALDASLPARGPASDGQGGTYPAEPRFLARGGIALWYGMP
jgi:hypothetical protein